MMVSSNRTSGKNECLMTMSLYNDLTVQLDLFWIIAYWE